MEKLLSYGDSTKWPSPKKNSFPLTPIKAPLIAFSIFSNTHLFLSFHMAQNKHKWASLQSFFLFLPTKDPWQHKKAFFIEERTTYFIPNRAYNISHKVTIFLAMKEDVINRFFFFTHITFIWHLLSPSFELVQCQYPSPCGLPSKKPDFWWNQRTLNNYRQESLCISIE